MTPARLLIILSASILRCSLGAYAGEAAPRVIDNATPYLRPDNVPAASDVTMRTLVFRPRNENDPYDTFEALDAFHATRLEWVYLSLGDDEAEKIRRVKQSGRLFGGASNASSGTDVTWHEDGTATKNHVIIDPSGKPVIPPHMEKWARPQSPGCCNDPAFRKGHLDYLKRYIDAGVDTMQRDEPGHSHNYAKRGIGCYCPYCVAGFRSYLSERFNKLQLAEMGVDDPSSFDYRVFVLAKPGGRGVTLSQEFAQYQSKATAGFLAWIKREITAYADRPLTYSGNNTSFQRWEAYDRVFDFAISELMLTSATPGHIYDRAQKARSLGKMQVFGSPKTLGKNIPDEQLTRLKRQVIATSYASGALSRVPWDIFNQSADGKQRYFGKPKHFADLYAMVRASHQWLDQYCTAGAFGSKILDKRYGNQAPIQINQEMGDAHAFIRAIPGDTSAPVVIHLVDWGVKPGPLELRLRTDAFFPEQDMTIRLRTPRPYEADAHEQAAQRAQAMRKPGQRLGAAQAPAYEPLVQEITLKQERQDGFVTVRVPPVTPWGMLIVQPTRPVGQR